MPPEGLDEAREAFAQELPQASQQRDQGGRFVASKAPEPIFQPRETEGDERGDTRDGGADPRLLEQERKVADGRSEEGEPVPKPARRPAAPAGDNDEPGEGEAPERIGEEPGDELPDGEEPDKGAGAGGDQGEDASPWYGKFRVDGAEVEGSASTKTRRSKGYQREGDVQPPHAPDGSRSPRPSTSAARGGPAGARGLHPAVPKPGARSSRR